MTEVNCCAKIGPEVTLLEPSLRNNDPGSRSCKNGIYAAQHATTTCVCVCVCVCGVKNTFGISV
jgi:hypothetical protein